MSRFLVFVLEPYRLMVRAERVRELLEPDNQHRLSGGGYRSWRGRLVPEIDLAAKLGCVRSGGQAGAGVCLIYGGDQAADETDGETADDKQCALVTFAADRVLGLRSFDQDALRPLPRLGYDLARLFGGLAIDPADRRGILWLDCEPAALFQMAVAEALAAQAEWLS